MPVKNLTDAPRCDRQQASGWSNFGLTNPKAATMDYTRYDENAFLDQVYSLLTSDHEESLPALVNRRCKELDLSENQLARVLGIGKESLRRILGGEAQKVDILTMLKLSTFLGVGVDGLAKVFVAGMTPDAIGDLEAMRRRNYIVKHFDLDRLKKVGFIESVTDFEAIENRITRFFGLDTVFQYTTEVGYSLFSRTKRDSHDKMREMWVRSAYAQFQSRPNPFGYDHNRLLELVPQIRQYTRFEKNGLLKVAQALYRAGVTVIAQKYLSFTQVKGATFIVEGKPCVVVTDFGGDYATAWFTLMHELAHILYHWDKLETTRYHLTGEDDLFLIEDEADHFARELLFPSKKLAFVEPFIDNPHLVKRYAEQEGIHPSIIYSFYAYRRYADSGDSSGYAFYKKLMASSDDALKAIRCHPWDKETVTSDIDHVITNLNPS